MMPSGTGRCVSGSTLPALRRSVRSAGFFFFFFTALAPKPARASAVARKTTTSAARSGAARRLWHEVHIVLLNSPLPSQ